MALREVNKFSLIKIDLFGKKTDLVRSAIDMLINYEPEEGYHLAFSGGKDSIVIKKLADMAGVEYTAQYNYTTVDPPELIYFIKEHHPDVIMSYPEETMWELIPRKLMPPTRLVRYCCEVLKERSGSGRRVITGVRRAESSNRANRRGIEICSKDKTKTYVNPIINWSDSDVWEFIKTMNIPYCKLYDQGFDRLGCIMCPLASPKQMEFEAEKYPKFKEAYIRSFDRMLKVREEKGKETQWETGEEVMAWWLSGGKKEKIADGQFGMYEEEDDTPDEVIEEDYKDWLRENVICDKKAWYEEKNNE